MRYLPFTRWVAITAVLVIAAVSEFVFGRSGIRRLGLRVALSLVWPLALFSRAGREVLLSFGRDK
jgi:hypothetical protein